MGSNEMSEWQRFRQKVVAAQPEGEELGPRRFMVGVLLADRDPNGELTHLDFKWIKAHNKITIAKIHETYMSRHPEVEVDLWCEHGIAQPESRMSEFGTFDDPIIALRAVEKHKHPSPLVLRSPSSKRTLFPALVASHPPVPDLILTPARPQQPQTPKSADEIAPVPPLYVDFERARPSVETPVEPWSFSRVNSTPLSDVPSPLLHGQTPGASIPSPLSFGPRPLAFSSPYALSQRPEHLKDADIGPSVASKPVIAPKAEQQIRSDGPAQIKVKPEDPVPASSPIPEDTQPSQQFDADEIFERDPSLEAVPEEDTQLVDQQIRNIIEQQDVAILEAGVAKSMKILEKLQEVFLRFAAYSPDANLWSESIDRMKEQSKRSRTVVGVVGNTGAGKSSVINALLDEERLVPTNCMRACTAVVTEISWNMDDDPNHKYRAEIEFISRADWENDLSTLMEEFLTESGTVTREAADPNSDAGIAWAKFHAVYPRIHKDQLESCTVEKLMAEDAVLNVLGTTKRFHRARPEPFYAELQKFVDSKEKITDKKDKDKQKQPKTQMEFWPLIKVVRLYTKSEALSTGAVVVDLPGVQDSNAARAAVADRYIQQCSGLWIVAPITRAVDDKAAKNLMGDAFKRQLKYDGNYSAVTFICSKTDDISITEATDSLDLNDRIHDLESQMHAYKQEFARIENEITDFRESAEVYKTAFDEADEEIEIWEDVKDRVETETVFAPQKKKQLKRKKTKSTNNSRKRRVLDDGSDIEYVDSESDGISDSENDTVTTDNEADPEPLTLEDVEQKLVELKNTKKNARQESKAAQDKIKELRPAIRATKSKIADGKAQILAICIEGRNEYSKSAIRLDFAAGIKELDQEAAMEADEEAFNPDEELRDYDEVANSLPVFCVSSRAYQKMCGRLKKDEAVPGFRSPEETEVPQLKSHCMKLTESGRIQACRTFLLNLCQNLTTFFLWASNDGTGFKMTDADKNEQANYLIKRLKELEKGLEQAVTVCLSSMKTQLREQIFERMNELVHDAVQSAPTTAESWGRHRNEGGLHFSTYKATVRRGGAYHSSTSGPRDFNAELLDPIIKKLASGWERAFQQRLPRAFESYTTNAGNVLRAFHTRVEERARQNGVGLANLSMLKGSIYTYEQMFKDLNAQLKVRMTEAQREANRDFVPTLANIMLTVYQLCADESGIGSFARMKSHMTTFVQQHSPHMFPAAIKTVEAALVQMCRDLEQEMANKADEICQLMRADYMRVLGGVQVSSDVMNKPDRSLRAEVMAQLKQIDSQFERIANGDLTEDDILVERLDDDTGPGADMEAEQQLHFESTEAASAPESPADQASPNGENLDDTTLTEPSPAAHRSSSKQVRVESDDEDEGVF